MNIRSLFWWGILFVSAIVMQQLLPGFDALAPIFLLALTTQNKMFCFLLFIAVCLIQEGTGTLTFGMAPLWYGGQALVFAAGASHIIRRHSFFILVLSALFAAYRAGLFWLMCAIQNIPADYTSIMHDTILQAALTPIVWWCGNYVLLRKNDYVN